MENHEVYLRAKLTEVFTCFATAVPVLKKVGYVLTPGSNQRLK